MLKKQIYCYLDSINNIKENINRELYTERMVKNNNVSDFCRGHHIVT